MITISLCMIVKNEEPVLARCLDCAVPFADEIVIVDTGSTDRTVEIARTYTGQVYHFPWTDDFAAARNFSFSKATKDYLLWLDADDVIPEAGIARLLELKHILSPKTDIVMLPYHTGFDAAGNVTFRYYRERLVRRSNSYLWKEPVHEHIAIWGTIEEIDIPVIHAKPAQSGGAGDRNLRIYQGLAERGEALSTRGLYYFARELLAHGRFEEAVRRFREFLARTDGWVEDRICAASCLADCYTALGREGDALAALVASFAEDLPRAEICCYLGKLYNRRAQPERAEYWYRTALHLPRPSGWGFVTEDCWGYIPHMELCVLLDRAGRREEALEHHRAARRLKPDSPQVRHNEAYFSRVPSQA